MPLTLSARLAELAAPASQPPPLARPSRHAGGLLPFSFRWRPEQVRGQAGRTKGGHDEELVNLICCLSGAQANDSR
jgi:hypothetical protein